MVVITVRFAHYESRAPLFEIDIESDAQVSDLRAIAENRLANNENFSNLILTSFNEWYTEVHDDVEQKRRLISISHSDESYTLESLGLENFSVIYLDKPPKTNNGSDTLPIANANWHRLFYTHHQRTAVEIHEMKNSFSVEIASARQTISKLAELVAPAVKAADLASAKEQQARDAAEAARLLMAKYPNMKAFWEALNDPKSREDEETLIPMAIIHSPQCGLERKSHRDEGEMTSASTKKLNFGASPIILAAHAGRNDVVKALVSAGADVNARSEDVLYSALHTAASNGYMPSVILLIGKGANIEIIDINGRTPLHLASYNGHVKPVKLLVERGANFTTVDKDGRTALHLAACGTKGEDSVETIAFLISIGMDMDAGDTNGCTPLHLAAFVGAVKSIEFLVSKGAKVTALTKKGSSPLAMFKQFMGKTKTRNLDFDRTLELLKTPPLQNAPEKQEGGPQTYQAGATTTTLLTPTTELTPSTTLTTPNKNKK